MSGFHGVETGDPLDTHPPLGAASPRALGSPDSASSASASLSHFHSTLERLLRTATAQLSDIAVLYAMSAKANSQLGDLGGIFSPAQIHSAPLEGEEVPVAIARDIRRPARRRKSPPTTSMDEARNKVKTKKPKRGEMDFLSSFEPRSVRQDPAFQDLKFCPDCGRKGNGSRSQSGLIYYYCRNPTCPGRGATADKFIGWSKS